jgi:phosphoserine aminotransferase
MSIKIKIINKSNYTINLIFGKEVISIKNEYIWDVHLDQYNEFQLFDNIINLQELQNSNFLFFYNSYLTFDRNNTIYGVEYFDVKNGPKANKQKKILDNTSCLNINLLKKQSLFKTMYQIKYIYVILMIVSYFILKYYYF